MAHEPSGDGSALGPNHPENADNGKNRAKALLKQREEEYRTLFENLDVGVYRTTAVSPGRFIKANPAFARMFGFDTVEELMKRSVAESYFEPEDRKEFLAEIARNGCARRRELRLKKKDGSPFWGSVTVTTKYDEDGKLLWMDGLIEDITERKESREMLEQTNEILKNILSASPIGIGMVENGRIRWANEEMARIFGFDDETDYKGRPLEILYPSKDEYKLVIEEIDSKFNTDRIAQLDANFARKDGETFVGHFKMSCPDPSNPSNRAIFTIYDLAWRRQAEAEQLQKEKLQAVLEITGAVCHELNQPTQAILGYSELMMMSIEKDDPLFEDLKNLRQQIERIKNITEKLMSVTRYETKDYIEKKIIDIDKASNRRP